MISSILRQEYWHKDSTQVATFLEGLTPRRKFTCQIHEKGKSRFKQPYAFKTHRASSQSCAAGWLLAVISMDSHSRLVRRSALGDPRL